MQLKGSDPLFVKRLTRFLRLLTAFLAIFLVLTAQVKQGPSSEAAPKAEHAQITIPQFQFPAAAQIQLPYASDHLATSGGIAFFQTAQPEDNLRVQSLNIKYHPHNPDGQRLNLSINGEKISCPLPDWQLLPIAKYADSPYNSCITLSGHLIDKALEQTIKSNGGRVINYHPAFSNTVLGWYFKQTDIMLLDLLAIRIPDLPPQADRQYSAFDIPLAQKESAFQDVQDTLLSLQSRIKGKHRSWLISDHSGATRFDVYGNDLVIEAYLSFFCWRFLSDDPSLVQDSTNVRRNAMKSILQHEFDTDLAFYNKGHYSEDEFRTRLMMKIGRTLPTMLELHYSIAKINFKESDLEKLMSSYKAGDLNARLNTYTTQKLVDLWNISTLINCLYHVVPLESYSQSLSENIRLIRAINPDAWDNTLLATKYSAFFRYIKQSFPLQWKEFITSVRDVAAEEVIQTPTALYPSDNLLLRELLN
jgi:hypothetical protein